MLSLIAATRNPAKLRELARLAGDAATVASRPHDISLEALGEEAGQNVAEIAAAKAVAVSNLLPAGSFAVASDGGLLAPGLGNRWDPLRTRRFAGEAATDLQRAERLLAMATELRGEQRAVGWREALAIARNGVVVGAWTAESDPGLLAERIDPAAIAVGSGFWIPGVWRCPEFGGRLLAELSADELAARVDHWTRLATIVRPWLIAMQSSSA